ncbi:Nitrate/nitrite response regulator protein NarL [compost metagenome]
MTTPATQAMQTRVMLVDDHAMCRSGLSELLQNRSGMVVVAATGDREQVIPLLRECQPELMVLDLSLGPVDGLSVLRMVRTEGIEVPVVVLTMSNSEEDLSAALRAGVRGYLLKDMDPDDVIESIGRAARGELVVAPTMALKLAQMWQSGQKGAVKRDLVDTLTERERQVLEQVARGKSNKVIAQALDISHNTVKLHVRHIMAKLDLGSRVEAAVFAFEHRTASDGPSKHGDLESPSSRRSN